MWMRKKSLAAPMAAGICPPRRLWTEASSRVSSSERRPTSGGRHEQSALESLSELGGQIRVGERLEDHLNAGIEPSVMHNGVAGISRREQNYDAWPRKDRFIAKLAAVHAAR